MTQSAGHSERSQSVAASLATAGSHACRGSASGRAAAGSAPLYSPAIVREDLHITRNSEDCVCTTVALSDPVPGAPDILPSLEANPVEPRALQRIRVIDRPPFAHLLR